MALFRDDDSPIFTFSGYNIRWTELFTMLQAIGFFFGALCLGTNIPIFFYSTLTSSVIPEVWRAVSYPYFDPLAYRTQWNTVFSMFFVYVFFINGRVVESRITRTLFLKLYVLLILVPVIVLFPLSFVMPVDFAGHFCVTVGMMTACATLYPNMEWVGYGVTYRTFLTLFYLVTSASFFAYHRIDNLVGMWVDVFTAYAALRIAGHGNGMDWLFNFMELHQQKIHLNRTKLQVVKKQEQEATLDSVLDKISKRGMASLTPAERTILQRASADLKKRDRP